MTATHKPSRIAYYRVSTKDQSIEMQRTKLGGNFDKEFTDEGVSGGVMAANRPGFAALIKYVRSGDTIFIYALDRLGRDAIDIQSTIRKLLDNGVSVFIEGLGVISRGVGEIVLAVLAQVADLERQRITCRTKDGRDAARASLDATGLTHRGKESLGRPKAHDSGTVVAWRKANKASIKETAEAFGISIATVKRYATA